RRLASVSRSLAFAYPARARTARACSSSRESTGMRRISERYTARLARLVSRVSSRTSLSSASTRTSIGSSGRLSSCSSLIMLGLFVVRLLHVRVAPRQRKHVERIVSELAAADLEVPMVRRGAPGPPHRRDALASDDAITDLHHVLVVVGVHRHEAVAVLDLDDPSVAALVATGHDDAGRRRDDRNAEICLDVD